jgi:hypothetical protein
MGDYDQEMRAQLAAANIVGDRSTADLMLSALRGRNRGDRREAEAICRAKWWADS